MNNKGLFLSWMRKNRRAIILSSYFEIPLVFYPKYRISKYKFFLFFNYLFNFFKTMFVLVRVRPDWICVQTPPFFSLYSIYFVSIFFKFKVIIDAHNASFGKPWIFFPFYRWSLNNADALVVHNSQLLDKVRKIYKLNNLILLNDKLVGYNKYPFFELRNYIHVVTSYSSDEPVDLIFETLRLFVLESNVSVVITGNYNIRHDLYLKYKEFFYFTGYVKDDVYFQIMYNSLFVISLSDRSDVQQCASVEALSFYKYQILYDNETNRSLFGSSAFYISNNNELFLDALRYVYANIDDLNKNVELQRHVWDVRWREQADEIFKIIY